MMKPKCLLLFFILMFVSSTFSAIYVAETTQKQIQKSNLIVRAVVESISVDTKNRITLAQMFDQEKGTSKVVEVEGPNSIITTFSLKINELLYGTYNDKELIEVEMSGGCYDDVCLEVSSNYNLETGEEYLIFLSKDEVNNVFKSTSASYSVFKVVNENELIRLTDSVILSPHEIINNKSSHLTPNLAFLRKEIEEYKNNLGKNDGK